MTAVGFTPRARRDLAEIWDFTAVRWGPEQADRYVRTIMATIEEVAAGTRKGRPIDDVRAGYQRIRSGSHLIFFRPGPGGRIDVVRVLHQRMDVGRHL